MPSGQVTAVTEHLAGSELSQAPNAGALFLSSDLFVSSDLFLSSATQLALVDLNEIDQDGGYVNVGGTATGSTLTGGEQVAYVVPDGALNVDGSGAIDLATSLSGSYVQGDPVYQVDINGTTFPERWCYFLESDGEEELAARVPHNLQALLTVGVRDPDTAEIVTAAEDGTDVVITDVLGKSPIRDLNAELITTDPSQSGERVDIEADGIREIESDGTTVAVSLTQAEGLDLLVDTVLANHIARLVRWLTASGVQVAYVGAFEDGAQDGAALYSKAGGARKATTDLYAEAPSGGIAQVHVESADSGLSTATKFYLSSPAAGQKNLLIDNAGVVSSDFLLDNAWTDWTPTLSGWSANPTNTVYRYKQIGKMVVASIRQATNGTSNATTKSITAPVAAATVSNMIWAEACSATDNGTALATSSGASIASGSSTINFSKDLSTTTGGWTASGGHKIQTCTLIYEAA